MFKKHEIDEESLLELTEKDLIEMGIMVGPKLKIMSRIKKLRGITGAESPRPLTKTGSSASEAEILSSSLGLVKGNN